MTQLILELKAAIVPVFKDELDLALAHLAEVAAASGAVIKRESTPYSKPPDSWMLRVQAVCTGSAEALVREVVDRLQGSGWIVDGNEIESEAIWSPREGVLAPMSPTLTWAFVQAFPMSSKVDSIRRS